MRVRERKRERQFLEAEERESRGRCFFAASVVAVDGLFLFFVDGIVLLFLSVGIVASST